jgi:DNA polymerase-3 subunit delta
MALTRADAARWLARPDPAHAAVLIFGQDALKVRVARSDAEQAIAGPQAMDEMRLSRLTGADLRRDPAALLDAVKAVGFFPGPRAVTVDDVTDGLAGLFADTLRDWRDGDARIIVTAGGLTGKSALKTAFDRAPRACVIAFYDDPPTEAEIRADLARSGVVAGPEGMSDLMALSRVLDTGEWRQTLEKLALYKSGDPAPLSPDEIALMAPATSDAEVDEIVMASADRDRDAVGRLMRRLVGQRVTPVTIAIRATHHFRALHGLTTGAAAFLRGSQAQRRRTEAQARAWSQAQIETALGLILDCDLALRSGGRAPGHAMVERCLMTIASMRR